MSTLKKAFRQCIFSLLVCAAASLHAESFRVHKLIPVTVSENPQEQEAGINDALALTLPQDMTFVNGIELTFKIPQDIATWRDSVAYSVYDGITPKPDSSKIDYEGKRLSVGTFPGKLSLTIFIPLAEDFSVKDSPYYEKIPVIPDAKGGTVFFRMQLAMKGTPTSLEESKFKVSAKPVYRNKGKLSLRITEPKPNDTHPYAVFIDGNETNLSKPCILSVGEHHLSITSESYRNEVRTFRIEQARTTALEVALKGIEPTLKIVSPENAKITFDGSTLTSVKDEFVINPGDHTIVFSIGDYELVKTVTAVNGRSYTVNLAIDATVSESD